MKILLYTVSDFKSGSIDCIDMMLSKIKDKNFDFLIISNREEACKYSTIVDKSFGEYAGFLKYSSSIPRNYDQYVYLDSDILYLGHLHDLFNDSLISITKENLPMNQEWFKYPFDNSEEYLSKIYQMKGVNAGSFCFKDIGFIDLVRSFFISHITNDVMFNAMLEQSSFNYALCKYLNFDFTNIFDFTEQTQLFAHQHPFSDNKKLYHFCGFDNSMNGKIKKMIQFLYENSNRIN
jgi:hypothetical protein